MARASLTTAAFLVAFSCVGWAAAQTPPAAPPPSEAPGAAAPDEAPAVAPSAPAAPAPEAAPAPPAPTPPVVQTFEPADVTGPKGGEPAPVSTTPAKTAPNALPL